MSPTRKYKLFKSLVRELISFFTLKRVFALVSMNNLSWFNNVVIWDFNIFSIS